MWMKPKMSNKHIQQNVINGWYILMDETDHKDKIVWRCMNCDHFNPNENLGDIFNTKILQKNCLKIMNFWNKSNVSHLEN